MMEINKIYQGDALSVLQTFPDNSIDMCMTSPPYWGLRDYGVEQIFGGDKDCEHEWGKSIIKKQSGGTEKATVGNMIDDRIHYQHKPNFCLKCNAWKGQLGLESTPERYIQHMIEIFHEVKRVLKKEGTLWVVIGDTYGGSCQGGGDTGLSKERYRKELLTYKDKPQKKMMPKCLMMIPERLAWAMIQDGWILRNKNIWYKHNGMPSSVRDRFSNKYEFVYMFSQAQKYYFDLDAVREETIWHGEQWGNVGKKFKDANLVSNHEFKDNPAGKNPGDVFEINTQPFPEAHFAVYPVKLCEKPIKAGCPKEVCVKCGKARERIVEKEVEFMSGSGKSENPPKGKHENEVQSKSGSYDIRMGPVVTNKTIGWTSCDCNAGFKPGVVVDPFSGAGTTCYMAAKMGRDFIGIEISEKYKAMSEDRIFGSLFKKKDKTLEK